MVDEVKRWLSRANTKQRQYLANLFTIIGGGAALPIWQFLQKLPMKVASWNSLIEGSLKGIILLTIAIISLSLGYFCLEDQNS